MDRFRYERGRIGQPGRASQSEEESFPEAQLANRTIWKEALDVLINNIETERAKIGPLTCNDLTDHQIIYETRELEKLINDYLRLKRAGRRKGYDDSHWF